MTAPQPRLILPKTGRRDALIAGVCGLAVMAFIVLGIMHMAEPVVGNKLTGVIVGREFTPFKERQISFTGRKIEEAKEIDGEYVLKVRVEAAQRVYEVPVEKSVYEAKRDGDALTFLKPLSEQH